MENIRHGLTTIVRMVAQPTSVKKRCAYKQTNQPTNLTLL